MKRNADPNARDSVGRTPLHIAFYNENRGAIQALVDAHADLQITDNMGRKPNETIGPKGL